MANTSQNFPAPQVPMVDPGSWSVTQPWRQFFQSLWNRTGSAQGADTTTAIDTANNAQSTADSALAGSAASLKKASNLSDVLSVATSRNNLGLGGLAVLNSPLNWAANPTGAGSRATFDMDATQVVSNPPTQAQVQAINDQLLAVQKRIGQLIIDLRANGILVP